jgi:hypothetical protein
LADLQKCSAPFQCAHGRPSVAPIVDVNKLDPVTTERAAAIARSRLNFAKLRTFGKLSSDV